MRRPGRRGGAWCLLDGWLLGRDGFIVPESRGARFQSTPSQTPIITPGRTTMIAAADDQTRECVAIVRRSETVDR